MLLVIRQARRTIPCHRTRLLCLSLFPFTPNARKARRLLFAKKCARKQSFRQAFRLTFRRRFCRLQVGDLARKFLIVVFDRLISILFGFFKQAKKRQPLFAICFAPIFRLKTRFPNDVLRKNISFDSLFKNKRLFIFLFYIKKVSMSIVSQRSRSFFRFFDIFSLFIIFIGLIKEPQLIPHAPNQAAKTRLTPHKG